MNRAPSTLIRFAVIVTIVSLVAGVIASAGVARASSGQIGFESSLTSSADTGGESEDGVGTAESSAEQESAAEATPESGDESATETDEDNTGEGLSAESDGTSGSSDEVFTSQQEEEQSADESEPMPESATSAEATPEVFEEPQTEDSGEVEVAEEEPIATVEISATVYNCDVDPDESDPSTSGDCELASGVDLSVTADGEDHGSATTDGSGSALFTVTEDSNVIVSEDWETVADGYSPRGDGTAAGVASESLALVIINVADTLIGRLQVSSGQCLTLGDPRTMFVVLGPIATAASTGCEVDPFSEYILTGDVPGGSMTIVTDESGDWMGFLPAGDYTISRGPDSEALEVLVDQSTVVIAVNYVPGPRGTLTVQRYRCTEGTHGTVIDIFYGGGGVPPSGSCELSSETVTVVTQSGNAAPLHLDLGGDGETTVEVAEGSYVIQDVTGAEQSFDVSDTGWTQAIIVETSIAGAIAAQFNWCPDPSSGFEDPGTLAYWTGHCGPGNPGLDVFLYGAGGDLVASAQTGGEGSVFFDRIDPGTYSLDVGGVCALFAGGVDARSGFAVTPGELVQVAAYGCAEPLSNPPDPGGDGSGQYGGPGLGDDGYQHEFSVGNMSAGQPSELYVTTLPATGSAGGAEQARSDLTFLLTIGLSAFVVLGYTTNRRRRLSRGASEAV